VFEPFCGSGTTMLAAQRTGRVARATEIAPEYVDVAIKRFQQNFPEVPVHLEATGRPLMRSPQRAIGSSGMTRVLAGRQDRAVADRQTDALCPQRAHPLGCAGGADRRQIAEFGFTNPILAGSDGVIVAGHGRLAAAQKLGIATVPVVVLDHLTPTQRRALVIADNRIAENAGWDEAMLQVELADLQDDNFDLDLTGFDADALADLMAGEETTSEGRPMRMRCRSVGRRRRIAPRRRLASGQAPRALRRRDRCRDATTRCWRRDRRTWCSPTRPTT
jgi:hypothetical protein